MKRLVIIIVVSVWWLGWLNPAWAVTEAQMQTITQQWQSSVHALNDINCTSCHQNRDTKAVVVKPDHESCRSCHGQAVETFLIGKHGIRLNEKQTPLTPAMAHLPMQANAATKAANTHGANGVMNCNTCHNVHSVNTVQASVDSCLSCHGDDHSRNYGNSRHGQLFASQAKTLPRPNGESVTCATCHLPRQPSDGDSSAAIVVNHNNTFTLLPRDRMVQEVCMQCHGMEYSFNNIFDEEVVQSNFAHPSSQDLETLRMIRRVKTLRSPTSSSTSPADVR